MRGSRERGSPRVRFSSPLEGLSGVPVVGGWWLGLLWLVLFPGRLLVESFGVFFLVSFSHFVCFFVRFLFAFSLLAFFLFLYFVWVYRRPGVVFGVLCGIDGFFLLGFGHGLWF